MSEIRKPTAAGSFYPVGKKQLDDKVKKLLFQGKKEHILGCIVPHAGYMFSGKLMGEIIGKIDNKKNFILLGVNHSGFGNDISLSLQDFETPLGIVKNNNSLGERILLKLKKEKLDAGINERSHEREHSLEVELPFLQVNDNKFEIVPILLKDLSLDECKKTAKVLSEFLSENVFVLVSSDFTHYGRNYGFVPFTKNIKDNLYDLDRGVIRYILDLDSSKVFREAEKTTICGKSGIVIITEISKIEKWESELVDYYTSGDVTGDWDFAVGYGGIVFK